MDNTFEIRDGEININDILTKIHNNIEKRYSGGYVDLVKKYEDEQKEEKNRNSLLNDIKMYIEYINNNYDIKNNSYVISSHRPILGKFLIKGRELVHGEVRRYIDPSIYWQVEFNNRVANVLKLENERISQIEMDINKNINSLEDKTKEITTDINNRITFLEEQILQLKSNNNDSIKTELINTITSEIKKDTYDQLKILSNTINLEIQNRAWMTNLINVNNQCYVNSTDTKLNANTFNYFIFSEEIGKSWNKIGGRSFDEPNVYNDVVELFKNCKNVLDIGCGKGYLLHLLKESNISSYGIDINEDYILYCKRLGLTVKKDEAISHLKSLEDKILDGIFISHVIEHLTPREIIELLKLCYDKLQYDSYIVILTPNILSMIVAYNLFYMDPTHKTPIHPEVIKFILRSCGFRDIEERFYQPIPNEMKLKYLNHEDKTIDNNNLKSIIDIYNYNIDKLNSLIFGYRDYMVFAKK